MLIVTLLPDSRRFATIQVLSKLEQRTGLPLLTLIAMILWGFWRIWKAL
jgi:hypothetical protein